jgi:outer membrane protein TolC
LLLAAASATAAEPAHLATADQTLTPDALVALVLQSNPGIAEMVAAAEAASAGIETAGALDDPDFSYAFAPRTFGREGQGLNQRIEISQRIPWPGTLSAKEQRARALSMAADDSVDALRLQIAAFTNAAFAEWYFADRALAIHRLSHALLDELYAVAEARYAAGRGLQQDVLQVEIEQIRLRRHGLRLEKHKDAARAGINALLNRPPESALPVPADIQLPQSIAPLELLQDHALASNPQLRELDARIDAYGAAVTVAQKALLPDLSFAAGYNSLWDEADKRFVVGISINVPLNRSKRKAEVSRTKWEMRRAEARRDNQRAQLLGELARARAELVESLEAVRLFEDSLLPLADEFLDAALSDYQSGAGDFQNVITAEQHKLSAAEELERNRADYLGRAAELDRWAGVKFNETGDAGWENRHEQE